MGPIWGRAGPKVKKWGPGLDSQSPGPEILGPCTSLFDRRHLGGMNLETVTGILIIFTNNKTQKYLT